MKLELSLVTYRPPLCRIGCNLLVRKSLWMHLLGSLLSLVGSVSSREIFTTLRSKVARSFVSDSILNSSCIAEPPRCDPKRGQREGQCGSFSGSNGSSVAGAGRSSGLCLSSRIIPTISCPISAGNLASSRSGAPGSVDGDRAGAARWLRAGAARRKVGKSSLALDRSGAPGSVDGDRAGAARWLRAGAARSEVGESSLASDRSGAPGSVGVARADAARLLRADAARSEVGETSRALNRGGAPGRVEGGRVEAARRTRAGAARGKAGDLALNRQACRQRVDSSGSATDF